MSDDDRRGNATRVPYSIGTIANVKGFKNAEIDVAAVYSRDARN